MLVPTCILTPSLTDPCSSAMSHISLLLVLILCYYFHSIFLSLSSYLYFFFFFQAEDGIRDDLVTGVQTCALPISVISDLFSINISRTNRCSRRRITRKTLPLSARMPNRKRKRLVR